MCYCILLPSSAPSVPQNFMVVDTNSTAVMLSWQPPVPPNGVIANYSVWYTENLICNNSQVSNSSRMTLSRTVNMYTFTGLEEDTPYEFYVSAETSAGEGEAATVMGRTLEYGECVCMYVSVCVCVRVCVRAYGHACVFPLPLPSVPAAAPTFTIDATTANSITVAWQPLPGCDQNGVITNYTIAYTIVGNTTFTNTVVGAADRSAVISPLTPFTSYTIKMAASTSVGLGRFGDEVTVQTNEAGKKKVSL